MAKLTINERYLLNIICHLRGNAYDAWGRLESIRKGKETIKQAAPKGELKWLLLELSAYKMGAHLPHPNDPHLSDAQKGAALVRHRREAPSVSTRWRRRIGEKAKK